MSKTLDELLSIAHDMTHGTFGKTTINMRQNHAVNQSKYVQEFNFSVGPINNRTPKPHKDGGMIVSSAIGYRELSIWVYFGDNKMWKGTDLRWLYMNRSKSWCDELRRGGIGELEELRDVSEMLKKEAKRINKIESDYFYKHHTYDGLIVDGYADIGSN